MNDPLSCGQRYSILLDRLLNGNQWDRAANVARDWLAEDPAAVPAHRAMAQALVNLERYDAVAGHVERVLAGSPRDGFAHRLASIACFARKDFTRADDHIQQAIALQPQTAMHWYHLAWMRFQRGDHEAAARYGQRALELAPQSADTINLLALCQKTDARTRLAQYERALALDPENAMVHNNVGSYYLYAEKDPKRALESFRRALQFDPSNQTAQRNLLAALRECDPVYRALRLPRALLSLLYWRRPGSGWVGRALAILCCVRFGVFVLLAYGLWLIVGAPLLKGYEFLTLRDVRARAGVPGARRGGLWGFWRWPFAVRFGLYAAAVALFWSGVWFLLRDVPRADIVAWLIGLGALFVFASVCANLLRSSQRRWRSWYAERRFRRRMRAAGEPVPGFDDALPPLTKSR